MSGKSLQFLKIIVLIPVLSLISGWAFIAQAGEWQESGTISVELSTTDTLIHAIGGEIIGTTLLIENRSDKQFNGNLEFSLPEAVTLLSTLSEGGLQVDAHSKRYIPIRFRVNPNTPSGLSLIKINLVNEEQQTLSASSIRIRIQEKRLIRMQVLNTMELMRYENDSIKATLILRNTGNTAETIQLVSSVPTFYGSRRFQRELLHLESGKDTTVSLGFIADRELFHMNQFQINITGLYSDQEVFGNTSISVQNASSSRNFDLMRNYGFNWNQRTNRVSISTRDPLSDNQSFYMDANLQFNTPKGRMEMNSQLYHWGDWGNAPVLTNTYLRYTQNNLGLTLGNITESSEKFINGRGARVDYLDEESNYYFTAGVTDKSYDLLNRYGRMGFGTGYSVFSKYQAGGFLPEKGKRYAGTIIFDRDPIENAESLLHASSISLLRPMQKQRTNLDLDVGLGISRPLVDTLQQFQTQPSFALGALFSTEIGGIYFSSTNYYSSGYYPGSRRGSININQRAGSRWRKTNLWLGYTYLDYSPKTFIPQYEATQMITERMEMGFSWGLSPFSSLSVIPNRWKEQSHYPQTFNPGLKQDWQIISYRLESILTLRSRDNRHSINLSLESGFRENSAEGNSILYRGNLSYNFWKLNLNANYQRGGFSVFELINNAGNEKQDIYRMGGALNFNYLDRQFFRSYLGLQYYKDNFSGDNLSANARTEVSLGAKTAIFGQANVYRYTSNFFGSHNLINFQVGITQSLAGNSANNNTKRGDLQLFVFYDHNLNGVFDQGDEAAAEKSILINEVLFISDASGAINYRKVPYGQYSIRAPMERGWFSPDFSYTVTQKSDKVQIALQRSGTLRGVITIDFDQRLNLEANTNLEGYTITAVNKSGYIARTRSDNNGSFLFFLPEGEYTISLNEQEFPPNVYTELREQNLVLEPGKINDLPAFELKVRERKIEVKRFGSTP